MQSERMSLCARPRSGPASRLWGALVSVCALFAPCAADAGSTADDLAQIEAEHVVAKARLRLVETQAQIAARQADLERQAPLVHTGMPTVAGIEGMVGHLWATLQLENGFLAEVKVGDRLPNGMRVTSIAPEGVVVRTASNHRVRLKPAAPAPSDTGTFLSRGAAPATPYQPTPPAVMSMPPLPAPPAPPQSSARAPLTPGLAR